MHKVFFLTELKLKKRRGGGQSSRGQFTGVAIIRGAIFSGVICWGAILQGAIFQGAILLVPFSILEKN